MISTSMILNELKPQNRSFSDVFALFGCRKVNCDKMDRERPRLLANRSAIGSRASHEH